MLGLGKMDTPTEYERPQPYDNGGASPRIDPDGGITWRVPIEVSVRLPGFGNGNGKVTNGHSVAPAPAPALVPAEEATKPSQHYGDRSGYKPRFIEGIDVPLPALSAAQQQIAARNKQAQSGDDPFELKYHHFSVVMNKARRLAFFTACNIDGLRAKHVDRKTGDVDHAHRRRSESGEPLGGVRGRRGERDLVRRPPPRSRRVRRQGCLRQTESPGVSGGEQPGTHPPHVPARPPGPPDGPRLGHG